MRPWGMRSPAVRHAVPCARMLGRRVHLPLLYPTCRSICCPQIARVLTNEWFYIDMPGTTQVNYTDKVPIGNCYFHFMFKARARLAGQ